MAWHGLVVVYKLNHEAAGCLDSVECGTVEWNSGTVEWWNRPVTLNLDPRKISSTRN